MKNTRREWIDTMSTTAYTLEKNNPGEVGAIVTPKRVIFVDTRKAAHPRIGVAKCNTNEDKFDLNTGLAIAYARAFNIEVPDYVIDDGLIELWKLRCDDTFTYMGDNYVLVFVTEGGVYLYHCYNLTKHKSVCFKGYTKVKQTHLR